MYLVDVTRPCDCPPQLAFDVARSGQCGRCGSPRFRREHLGNGPTELSTCDCSPGPRILRGDGNAYRMTVLGWTE